MTEERAERSEDLRAAEQVVRALREACGDDAGRVVEALRGGELEVARETLSAPALAVYEALLELSDAPEGADVPRWVGYGCMLALAAVIVFAVIGLVSVVRQLLP